MNRAQPPISSVQLMPNDLCLGKCFCRMERARLSSFLSPKSGDQGARR